MGALKNIIAASTVAALSSFAVAGTASAATIDFDDITPGTPVTMIGGVTFSTNIGCCGLVVSTGLETTSGANYLGVDDGGVESFLGGDEITFDFAAPITELTLSVVAVLGLPAGTFMLSGGGADDVSGAPDLTLLSGDEVFILTIADLMGFTSATLSAAIGLAAFNIDDIIFDLDASEIPAPGGVILMLTGLAGLAGRRFALRRAH